MVSSCSEVVLGTTGFADCIAAFGLSRVDPHL